MLGEREEMTALRRIEPEGAAQPLEELRRDLDLAALLEPGVPGDTDPGELREFLATQAGGAAAASGGQAHVLRRDALPAGAQERGEFGPAGEASGRGHVSHPPAVPAGAPGGASTRISRLLVPEEGTAHT